MKKLALVTGLLLSLGWIGQASATPLIDFTNDGSSFIWYGNDAGCGGGCTLGYSFNLTADVTIDGLGVYDHLSDGLNNVHEVGLWTSAGALLASTSVGPTATGGDLSASGDGTFRYSDIAALTLGAGAYVVGALFETGDTDHVVFGAQGIFSNDAAASYGDLAWVNSGTLTMPTNTAGSDDRYFGAGVRIASSVPEPAGFALLGLGLVGLALRRKQA